QVSDREISRADADLVEIVNYKPVHDSHQQVSHGCGIRATEMEIALDFAAGVTREEDGNAPVFVNVGVSQWAPIHDEGMVEEIAICVGSVPELLEKRRDGAHMVLVEFGEFSDGLRIFSVMRKCMERGLHSAFGEDC